MPIIYLTTAIIEKFQILNNAKIHFDIGLAVHMTAPINLLGSSHSFSLKKKSHLQEGIMFYSCFT